MSDMRLEAAGDRYYYPDIGVVCTPIAELDIGARGSCVVVEVPDVCRSPGSLEGGRLDGIV